MFLHFSLYVHVHTYSFLFFLHVTYQGAHYLFSVDGILCPTIFLIGEKAQKEYDSIVYNVLRTDWSAELPQVSEMFFVTWGSSEASLSSKLTKHFGLPLGQLEEKDFVEIVSKALTTFSEFKNNVMCSLMYIKKISWWKYFVVTQGSA